MTGFLGGQPLPTATWRGRHRALCAVLALHGPVIWIYAALLDRLTPSVLQDGLILVILALLAIRSETISRLGATLVAAAGLAGASAVIVALSDAFAPGSYHMIFVVSLVALYQNWGAFGVALLITMTASAVIGQPIRGTAWAIANGIALLVVGGVNLIAWALAEASRSRETAMARRSQLVLDAATEGVYGLDRDGRLTFINPAAVQLFGWPADELLGRSMHEMTHHTRPDGSAYPREDCPMTRSIREGTTSRIVDEIFWRRDGSSFPVRYTATPLLEEGVIAGAVVTFEDRSARARAAVAEAEISRLVELEQAQRDVLSYLQETIRPPKPEVPSADLGVHYLPSEDGAPTGGDLYDWQLLPDGTLHIAVIDVVGKGVAATKDALAVAHALRLSALAGRALIDLVRVADELVTAQSPDVVATVLIAHYNPATGLVRLAGASHPPALHIAADGTVSEISAPGIAIGWPGAGTESITELTLARNDSLLLYTDGLIEASKNLDVGLMEVGREAALVARYPPDQLARALVERMLGRGTRRDDTLAVVLRRRTPPQLEGRALGPFSHRFRANEAVVPLARHLLTDWLANQPVEPADVEDLPLVVSELCSNAVRAARTEVILRAWADGDALIIEVEDDGGRPVPRRRGGLEPEVPAIGEEHGRGLYLAESLTDEMTTRVEEGRTIVRATRKAVLA
ncbi:MAG TPA: SpoIIE family protein phosphatase [Acidimicrobiales bacterium]|nr:SpoIIE family protein phosphatase [Acidimicrobiales bacterium]